MRICDHGEVQVEPYATIASMASSLRHRQGRCFLVVAASRRRSPVRLADHFQVGPRTNEIDQWCAKRPHRIYQPFTLLERTTIAEIDGNRRETVPSLRKTGIGSQLIGSVFRILSVEPQHLPRLPYRIDDLARESGPTGAIGTRRRSQCRSCRLHRAHPRKDRCARWHSP